jgi:hypothetical protein
MRARSGRIISVAQASPPASSGGVPPPGHNCVKSLIRLPHIPLTSLLGEKPLFRPFSSKNRQLCQAIPGKFAPSGSFSDLIGLITMGGGKTFHNSSAIRVTKPPAALLKPFKIAVAFGLFFAIVLGLSGSAGKRTAFNLSSRGDGRPQEHLKQSRVPRDALKDVSTVYDRRTNRSSNQRKNCD